MKRSLKVTIAILVGLPLGFFGRGYLEPEVDRVATAMALLVAYCQPFVINKEIPTRGQLVRLSSIGVSEQWVEPKSRVMLEINARSCDISDTLDYFNTEDRALFSEQVREYVKSVFPTLAAEDSLLADTWERHEMWMQYERGDARRWGISMSRNRDEGSEAITSVTTYRRKN